MKIRYEADQKAIVFRDDAGVPVRVVETLRDAKTLRQLLTLAIKTGKPTPIAGVTFSIKQMKAARAEVKKFLGVSQ